MITPIKLSKIVDSLDMQSDESAVYLDRRTAEVLIITDEEVRAAEENEPLEEHPEWQRESIIKAKEFLENQEAFVPLPDKFEIHEWSIMSDFSSEIDSPTGDELREALRGNGAFQRFKSALNRFGLVDRWFEFRATRYREIAKEWCESNGVAFINDIQGTAVQRHGNGA